MRFHHFFFILISLLPFASCGERDRNDDRRELARVGDRVLYFDELPATLQYDVASSDSVMVLRGYADKWVRSMLLFVTAEKSLGRNVETVERQLEDYRRSLYAYEYERRYLTKHLDTVVSAEEVRVFYEANTESFVLAEPIVRAVFVVVPQSSDYVEEFRATYRVTDDAGVQALSSLSMRSGILLRLVPEDWVPLSYIERQLPLGFDSGLLTRQARNLEVKDGDDVYLVSFSEWRQAGSVAPLEYVSSSVRNVILNQREMSLLQDLESRLLQEAISSGVAKISI